MRSCDFTHFSGIFFRAVCRDRKKAHRGFLNNTRKALIRLIRRVHYVCHEKRHDYGRFRDGFRENKAGFTYDVTFFENIVTVFVNPCIAERLVIKSVPYLAGKGTVFDTAPKWKLKNHQLRKIFFNLV